MNNQQITFSQRRKNYFHLCRETSSGNRVKVRNLIDNGVDVNIPDVRDDTPLHWAITHFEDLQIMMMLLDKGANIHAKNEINYKPLHVAINHEKTEAASLLIERGALDGGNLDLYLLMAIEKDNQTMVKMLIDHGMQYNTCIDLKILNTAIRRGHPKVIEHIIPHCGFSKPSDHYIPKELVIGSSERHRRCVELLLKWNFTITPNSHQDEDFIYGAVKNGHLPIFLELLKVGINDKMVNSRTKLNLLTIACLNKRHDIVEILLQHNADVNVTMPINTEIKNNLLSRYHSCGVNIMTHTDNTILENKRYIMHQYNQLFLSKYNTKDLWDITCLHIAVLNSDPMMIKLLLKYGAMLTDDPTFFNITYIAVRVNYEDIVRIFLDHGVNVNDIDAQGKSLLHFCVNTDVNRQHSRHNIAKLLLEKGATIQIQTPGNTLVFEAIKNGYRQTAQLFLDYNADIQYISPDGDTLLHKGIEEGFDAKFVKTLLKLNSPVNSTNNNKLTPLLVACKTQSSNQLEIIKALLHYNANVNCVDDNLMTPLHFACEDQHLDFVSVLLKNGANPNIGNIIGQTPLHIICNHKNGMTASIIQLLLEHGSNIEATDVDGWTPLLNACEAANHSAVQCLLDNNANVNHTDFETGETLLHIAVRTGSLDMIENLIKYGADINILDKKYRIPLQNAAKFMSINSQDRGDSSNYSVEAVNLISAMRISRRDPQETFLGIKQIFRKQVIKLKVAMLKVNVRNLQLVYHPNQFLVECVREIQKMKVESIGVNNMTFYDLLKKNIHILSRFVKTKELQQILELEVYDEKFPLYIDIIRSRFRDAKLRYRLMNTARKYFRVHIYSQLSDSCLDIVFSYLTIEEIEIFVRNMKLLVCNLDEF